MEASCNFVRINLFDNAGYLQSCSKIFHWVGGNSQKLCFFLLSLFTKAAHGQLNQSGYSILDATAG